MKRLIVLATLLLWMEPACVMATPEPSYTVISQNNDFEVREYPGYLVAETVVASDADHAANQGFRILAAYIFGQNKGAQKLEMTAPVVQAPVKIEMTAPVTQTAADGGYLIQFVMPAGSSLETLPIPDDDRVKLRAVASRRIAVVRYSGTWSQNGYEEHLQSLRAALAAAHLQTRGEPSWARYDPPWMPWFWRRNEIWLEVDGPAEAPQR